MELLATLRRSGGINALARQLDVPPATATAGVKALLPVMLSGFRDYTNGLDRLVDLLAQHGGAALASAVMSVEPTDSAPGSAIVGKLFPDSAKLSTELQLAADEAGSDGQFLAQLSPLLAMLIGGYVAARAAAGGLSESELKTLFADEAAGAPSDPNAI
jgi:hypothetical protein